MGTTGYIRLRKGQLIDKTMMTELHKHNIDQIIADEDPLEILAAMADGDTLVVNSIGDLSSGLSSLLSVLAQISVRQVNLISINEPWLKLDPTLYDWNELFTGLVQFNTSILSSRTKEALAQKRASGCKLGRPQGSKRVSDQVLRRGLQLYADKTMNVREICTMLKLNTRSFYRYIKEQQVGQ
ncbi:MAG: recombinase family protein [Mucinivorans sp.]